MGPCPRRFRPRPGPCGRFIRTCHGITDNGHTHAVTTAAHGHTVTDGGHTHTLTAQAMSTLPPYYALCFIMKL